ncbi:MAG: SGNH/GDSL hydrolase family protein [Lachnospiraceae bacterium]|nr:SGNH/GDSL hydrolase family protein [Lachnospiraceae bacterium]
MKISILGDSLSTYTGYNPEDYAVYYQEPMLWKNGMESVNDTWWMQVITALGRELCMKASYPGADIVCGTLIKTCLEGDEEWKFPSCFGGFEFDEYNRLIRACCRKKGCRLAELREQDIRYETHDGSHPTKKGHRQIAELWLNVLSDGRSVRTF